MVKRQREKQYNSAREQRALGQQRSGSAGGGGNLAPGTVQKRLPFSHCALTLQPYAAPVCTRLGIVFESAAILPFVLKHKIDPVTGAPITTKDLITLNMDREEDDGGNEGTTKKWQCPILGKPFYDHTKVVAIVQPNQREANVISYEAYKELNAKPKHYEDLISGEPFDPARDVVILNDPGNDAFYEARDVGTFYHIRNARALRLKDGDRESNVLHSKTASRIMEQLERNKVQKKQKKEKQELEQEQDAAIANAKDGDPGDDGTYFKGYVDSNGRPLRVRASDVTGVAYTTARASTSFTSTSVDVSHGTEHRPATKDEILGARFRAMRNGSQIPHKKAYVRLETTRGDVTVELHCDIAPMTCANFLVLCRNGAYAGTTFHRLVPNFMIQGGSANSRTEDKSEKAGDDDGREGLKQQQDRSAFWGTEPMKDEWDDRLKHEGPGIVAMANSGPNTNKQQFYITFQSCPHLDRKHTVFGKVVQGLEDVVLRQWNRNTPTDKRDRPKSQFEIRILATDIIGSDPYEEACRLEQARIEKLIHQREKEGSEKKGKHASAATNATGTGGGDDRDAASTVGRYLKIKHNVGKTNRNHNEPTGDDNDTGTIVIEGEKSGDGIGGGDEKTKKKKKSNNDPNKDDANRGDAPTAAAGTAAASGSNRLPPPPKKTTFGDFSGW